MYACVCLWRTSTSRVPLHRSLHCSREAEIVWQPASPGDSPSLPPSCGYRHTEHAWLFTRTLGIQTQVLMLVQQILLPLSYLHSLTGSHGSSFQETTGHSYPRGCCKSTDTLDCDGYNVSSDVNSQEVTQVFYCVSS